MESLVWRAEKKNGVPSLEVRKKHEVPSFEVGKEEWSPEFGGQQKRMESFV